MQESNEDQKEKAKPAIFRKDGRFVICPACHPKLEMVIGVEQVTDIMHRCDEYYASCAICGEQVDVSELLDCENWIKFPFKHD